MSGEFNKHILPHLEDTPLERITYPVVRGLIQMWQQEGLPRKSIKNLFGIVRAIYNFQFDEMAQCGKPIVSPCLVKWKKVAPPKTVQRELAYFTDHYTKLLRPHHTPEMAKLKPLLGRSRTPNWWRGEWHASASYCKITI